MCRQDKNGFQVKQEREREDSKKRATDVLGCQAVKNNPLAMCQCHLIGS